MKGGCAGFLLLVALLTTKPVVGGFESSSVYDPISRLLFMLRDDELASSNAAGDNGDADDDDDGGGGGDGGGSTFRTRGAPRDGGGHESGVRGKFGSSRALSNNLRDLSKSIAKLESSVLKVLDGSIKTVSKSISTRTKYDRQGRYYIDGLAGGDAKANKKIADLGRPCRVLNRNMGGVMLPTMALEWLNVHDTVMKGSFDIANNDAKDDDDNDNDDDNNDVDLGKGANKANENCGGGMNSNMGEFGVYKARVGGSDGGAYDGQGIAWELLVHKVPVNKFDGLKGEICTDSYRWWQQGQRGAAPSDI